MKNKNYVIKSIFTFLLLSLIYGSSLFAQVVDESIDDNVYDYLSRLSQKGIISYFDLVKPLSRKYIAGKLSDAEKNRDKLTKLEKEELKFYKQEYGYEIETFVKHNDKSTVDYSTNEYIGFAGKDKYNRFRTFTYKNKFLQFNFDPVFGYEISNWEKKSFKHLKYGVYATGYIGEHLGFKFVTVNNRIEPGRLHPLQNSFSPETNLDFQLKDKNRVEFARLNASIGTDWAWGRLTVAKDFITWGHGVRGNLVLSKKAPSFPFIRLDIHPNNWIHFSYIHAWLNSDVFDSSAFYPTYRVRQYGSSDRRVYIPKYFAQHTLTITPLTGLDLSIGESVVYADNLQIAFLIPIMFFDLADEYLNRNDNYAGSNTQLFLGVSSRNHIKNTHLYGSFFADELTPTNLFDSQKQYYKFGFTLGGSVVDLPVNNLQLFLEYTKIYPSTYRHFIPTLTYESSSVVLGHWLEDNADLIYAALEYRFFRGLKAKLWGQYVRKGEESLGDNGYHPPIPPFLFGLRKNYKYFGFDVSYEIFHELYARAHYQYINESREKSNHDFVNTIFHEISFSVKYGMF